MEQVEVSISKNACHYERRKDSRIRRNVSASSDRFQRTRDYAAMRDDAGIGAEVLQLLSRLNGSRSRLAACLLAYVRIGIRIRCVAAGNFVGLDLSRGDARRTAAREKSHRLARRTRLFLHAILPAANWVAVV